MASHLSLSSSSSSTPYNPSKLIVVAFDKDKNSASAVKWTIDNLVKTDSTLVLVHVRLNTPQPRNVGSASNNGSNNDAQQIFKSCRVYCARKRIKAQEVVLEDVDVATAILEYITKNRVTSIVLGASRKSPTVRKFSTRDLPTIMNKTVPDFCSVYVISNGQAESIRPAESSTPPKQKSSRVQSRRSLSNTEVDSSRVKFMNGEEECIQSKSMGSRIRAINRIDHIGSSFTAAINSTRHLSLDGNNLSKLFHLKSVDALLPDLETEKLLETAENVRCQSNAKELAIEMKRLKLQLKEALQKYNAACREGISIKQKVEAMQQLKLKGYEMSEQARNIGKATFALANIEKTICEAAYDVAIKAQRLAGVEGQRRKLAEKRVKKEAKEKDQALTVLFRNDIHYRRYTIQEIEIATNKFSSFLKIGEGGYGPVFKAKLDHTPVAIKVLRSNAGGGKRQFQQEIEVLCGTRHPNLVLLLGACPEYGCLVYEFMSNGSLEDRLFRKSNTPPIPWRIRFQLAADIATGLLFLHQRKPEPIVHRDIKPANILLDHNFVCKISDVGLSRLVPPSVADSVTEYRMTEAAGTFFYIDPEYQQTGKLGTKSDVYSLGVMLLQMITARPPMGLTHHVEKSIEEGSFADLVDPSISDWPMEETFMFAQLALKCVSLRKKDRPDLGSIIVPELYRLKQIAHSC